MTNKQQLELKINKGFEQLEILRKKKENIELNILNLENKIRNQQFQLDHIKEEKEIPESSQAKAGVESQSSIEDQILRG